MTEKSESAFYKNRNCKGFFREIIKDLFWRKKNGIKTMLRRYNEKGFHSEKDVIMTLSSKLCLKKH